MKNKALAKLKMKLKAKEDLAKFKNERNTRTEYLE